MSVADRGASPAPTHVPAAARPGRRPASMAALVALALAAALALPAGAMATTTEQAVAYQLDAGHDGDLTAAGNALTTPLTAAWASPVSLGSAYSYPLIVNGMVYVTVRQPSGIGTALYALSQASGATMWHVSLAGTTNWSGLAYDAGQVYTVNGSGILSAYDAITGTLKWSDQLTGSTSFTSAPTAYDGIVYTSGSDADHNGTLYAISETGGALVWSNYAGSGDQSSPAVDATNVYVTYAGAQDYAFNRQTGDEVWETPGTASGAGGSTPVVSGNDLFARDSLSGNSILSVSDGSTVSSPFAADAAPAVGGGSAYEVSNGALTQIGSSGVGTTGWTFTGDNQLDTAPLVVGNLVIEGSSAGSLYAIDSTTGLSSWSTTLANAIVAPSESTSTQPLTGLAAGEGTVIVPDGSKLYAYQGANVGSGTPTNVTPPTVSGSPQTSVPIGADVGTWSSLPSAYTYQWWRCLAAACSPISGAVGEAYTPTALDIGYTLKVAVAATYGGSTGTAVLSAASPAVTLAPPQSTALPTISGSAAQGSKLSATTGSWTNSPSGYGFQWYRCDAAQITCTAITSATQSTYTPVAADLGDVLYVGVTAQNGGGLSAEADSDVTATVAAPAPPVLTTTLSWLVPPAITGTAQVGSTLTTTSGSWNNPSTTFTYQWLRCVSSNTGCVTISGATGTQYTPTPVITGGTLLVQVTGTAGGHSVTVASNPTAPVAAAPAPTAPPVVTPAPPAPPSPTAALAALGVRLGSVRHISNLTHHGLGAYVDCAAACRVSLTLVATAADHPLTGRSARRR